MSEWMVISPWERSMRECIVIVSKTTSMRIVITTRVGGIPSIRIHIWRMMIPLSRSTRNGDILRCNHFPLMIGPIMNNKVVNEARLELVEIIGILWNSLAGTYGDNRKFMGIMKRLLGRSICWFAFFEHDWEIVIYYISFYHCCLKDWVIEAARRFTMTKWNWRIVL